MFIEAGFDWRGAGCSMCLAMNQDRLEGREICASSSNRNFKGRQGSPTGRTLLMSPAMVAAAAVAGESRRRAGARRRCPLRRSSRSAARALPLRGDSIDTDRIIPARFLKSISFEGLEQHLFEDDRLQADAEAAGTHPVSNPAYAGSAVLLVNANFGCGSSREHAPQAIRRWGIRAVVGESFSEIFFGNSVALGLPCLTASHDDIDRLQAIVERDPSTVVTVNLDTADDLRRRASPPRPRCRRRRGSRSSTAPGTPPRCCSIASRRSRRSSAGCRT